MDSTIEFSSCPSCGHTPPVALAPDGERIDTTLDLVSDHELIGDSGPIDFEALRDTDFVICPNCALIFLTRRSSPAAAREYYGRLFHRIEVPLPFDGLPIPERFVRRNAALARDLVRTLAANGLLEGVRSALYVRCNAGEGPRLLREEYGVGEVYALELLPSCSRHAKEVNGSERVERMHVPSIENPFSRRRFDLIICDEAFGHALDPAGVARDLKALLRVGGAVVVFNEKDHSQILKSSKLFRNGMNFFHKQLYTRRSLQAFLELQGFEITELPHPVVGKPGSLKNTKILFVLRPGEAATALLPNDEVAQMTALFHRWRSAHKWRKRSQRLLSLFRVREIDPEAGGLARRARSRRPRAPSTQ